jgi:NAD(P)H-hydrate epimerase
MLLATADQMRELDRRTIETLGIPGAVLMENAARGAVQVINRLYPDLRSIAVFSGKGNNGGDGLAMARYFHHQGLKPRVYLAGEIQALQGDAALQARLARRLGLPITELKPPLNRKRIGREISEADLVVDALLGTGLEKEVAGIFRDLIGLMNDLPNPKLAVDIPSGLSSDTGQPLGLCVRADATVTFGLPKIGQLLFPGSASVGRLFLVDIGLPHSFWPEGRDRVELLESAKAASFLPRRSLDGHKGSYGHLLVLAGSAGKTGAAAMTCLGALRAGAGLVTLGIPASLNPILEVKLTEAMTEPLEEGEAGILGLKALDRIRKLLEGKKALALGPGISTARETEALIHGLLGQRIGLPLVIDADGLNAVAANPGVLKNLKGRAILTPHPGEMARLTGRSVPEIQSDRIRSAREFARKTGVVLVLKGARTVIADPEGPVYVNPVAHAVLASGGTGDVLTGLIAGFLSQGLPPVEAACLGVFLHGLAGVLLAKKKGGQGILASELPDEIPNLISGKEHWEPTVSPFMPLIQEVMLVF